MTDAIETFALSYGPAGQAAGTVTYSAPLNRLTLTGAAGTEYRISTGVASDLAAGLISVEHEATGYHPLYQAQLGAVDSAGSSLGLNGGTYALLSVEADGTTGTVRWRVTIDGTPRLLTLTLTVVGEAVKLRLQSDGSTSTTSNFNSVYGGAFDGTGLDIVELPGQLIFPTATVTASGTSLWLGHFLDIAQSGAQAFVLTDPAGNGLNSSYQTTYSENTAGVLPGGIDETLWCIASASREDVRVHSNAASDQHVNIARAPRVFLTSKADGWATNQTRTTKLSTEWGWDHATAFPFWWWASPNYTTGSQDNGSSWAAGDAVLQAAFGTAVTAEGFKVMPYTYSTLEKAGTANYDASRRILDADGSPRESVFEAGTYLCRPEDALTKFLAQFADTGDDLQGTHGFGAYFVDVDPFVSPYAGGGGNFVNADSTSSTQTLATAVRELRRFYYGVRSQGGSFVTGEGPRGGYMSDFGILYEGCVDGLEGAWATNEAKEEVDPTYTDGRSPAQWPMDLGHAWNVRGKAAQDVWTHPDRFFTVHEAGLQSTPPGPGSLYPYSQAMVDLRRACQLQARRPGEVYLDLDWQNKMAEPEVVKEYYITSAVAARFAALSATDATIRYHDATEGYESFDTKWTREAAGGFSRARDSFRETRARVAVGTVTLWLNRGATDWALAEAETGLSGNVTLPENGYLVTDTSDGAWWGSFEATFTGGNRTDVAYVPGSHTLVDGRGTEVTVLGVTSTSGRMAMEHTAESFRLDEDENEEVQRTTLAVVTDTPLADTLTATSHAEPSLGSSHHFPLTATLDQS